MGEPKKHVRFTAEDRGNGWAIWAQDTPRSLRFDILRASEWMVEQEKVMPAIAAILEEQWKDG